MMTRLHVDTGPGGRPEAMADVPGVCELPLTRAVVQYRDHHEVELAGGRIEDIGLAVVLDGRTPSSADALDLGSGELKHLDLSTELVVLDWVYPPTLDHLTELLAARSRDESSSEARRLGPYCFELARQILARSGFGPLTRSTLLRIGFRDVCRDLDLHEGTSVRIVLEGGRIVRAHLDYDACALAFRTTSVEPYPDLEEALTEAFPGADVRRLVRVRDGSPLTYRTRFPLPLSVAEIRETVREMRNGLAQLLARFEPRRFRATQDVLDAFGHRETLATLGLRELRARSERVGRSSAAPPSPGTVH